MTASRLTEIKEKLETVKEQTAKAKFTIERISEEWKKKYGSDDPVVVKGELKKLEDQIADNEERKKGLEVKLEALADWDSL